MSGLAMPPEQQSHLNSAAVSQYVYQLFIGYSHSSPYLMSNPLPPLIPDLRRVVTSHNEDGISIVQSDKRLVAEDMAAVKGAKSAAIWVTTDSIPTNDNNNSEDGAKRPIDEPTNVGLVHPAGTNLRSTDLAPGAITPMHRTTSLDYNILGGGIHLG
ncbi:hypothetical protein BD779DRAFT_1464872 [Infundibulicybe gibba]|nr:hypothetical protein BD779DRAFT_1464872 [Infundibulicybe gibba]